MKARAWWIMCCVVLSPFAVMDVRAQMLLSAQNVQPVFEGWEENADGTFNLVFGYFNRNAAEHVYVPIGPNNIVEPLGPDAGQPEYFQPIRNMFVFRVKVPKDWGNKDVVWTLTHRGKTDKVYGSLLPVEIIDDDVIGMNFGGGRPPKGNNPPVVTLEGAAERRVKVGEPVSLVVAVKDDGIPEKPRPAPGTRAGAGPPGRNSATGVRVSWVQYRGGPEAAVFDPVQALIYSDAKSPLSPWFKGWLPPPLPADGRVTTKATFPAPGTYVLRAIAHDGYDYGFQDVRVIVTP